MSSVVTGRRNKKKMRRCCPRPLRSIFQLDSSRALFSSKVSTNYKLYGSSYSQPTRSVMLLLDENKISYELINVDPLKGESRTEEFRALNPTAQIPCLQEDAFVLAESAAIMQFLCNVHRLHDYYPVNPLERAKVDFWLSWHHTNTRLATRKVLIPTIIQTAKSAEILEQGKKSLHKSLLFMESHLKRGGNKFLNGGSHISIADLLILPELDQHLPTAFDLLNDLQDFPAIRSWISHCEHALPISYSKNFASVTAHAKQKKHNT